MKNRRSLCKNSRVSSGERCLIYWLSSKWHLRWYKVRRIHARITGRYRSTSTIRNIYTEGQFGPMPVRERIHAGFMDTCLFPDTLCQLGVFGEFSSAVQEFLTEEPNDESDEEVMT